MIYMPFYLDQFAIIQDLEMIETVWKLNQEWEGLWSDWKVNQFTELQTADMENNSQNLYKKLNRLSKELKVSLNDIKVLLRIF